MRVVNLEEMKEIESLTMSEYGFSESHIIENVGLRGADFIEEMLLVDRDYGEIIVLVGRGNNGADGLCVARHLVNRGHRVRAFLLFPDEELSKELISQRQMAQAYGVRINEIRNLEQLSSYLEQGRGGHLMIDAILGTGFRVPLSNYLFDVVNLVNNYAEVMVSVDIPSGITGNEGRSSSTAIMADYTLAIGLTKTGHYISSGAQNSGEVFILDAGFPTKLVSGGDKMHLQKEHFDELIGKRSKFAYKNKFGHSLVLGGSRGLTGALLMASEACLKVGTGLVTAATWRDNYGELVSRVCPEIMTGQIPTGQDEVESVLKDLNRYDSIVIGPGLSLRDQTREAVLDVLSHFQGPVVIDADAIKALDLTKDADLLSGRKFPTIMTPHMGEFSRFIGADTEKVSENPITYLKKAIDKTGCAIILKSACTFIGLPSGEIFLNYFPNDGMASGGSGDVLAGILGGLLAQHPLEKKASMMFVDSSKLYQSLLLGVYTHTLAGKHAVENVGARAMSATTIIEHFADAFEEIKAE